MVMDNLSLILLAIATLSFGFSDASIYVYRNGEFTVGTNSRFFHGGSEGVHASTSEELSYIRFDNVSFVRTLDSARKQKATQSNTGLVEAIVFEREDRDRIGATFLNSGAVCCTKEIAVLGVCSLGEVIIRRDDANDRPRRIKTFFQGNSTEARMSPETVVVNKTGLYDLYFLICDKELEGTTVTGKSIWRNPSGYLPANDAPLLSFFGVMSLAYLFLGFMWFLRFMMCANGMSHVQHQITLMIALGVFEMAIQYYDYADFNMAGIRPVEVTLWTVTFASVRKTICWLLLLLVAMGYGVLLPTQDGITPRVLFLGLLLFLETEAVQVVKRLGIFSNDYGQLMISLLITAAFLDGCFIVWIFYSLERTLEILKIKRDMVRLLIYRNFNNTLTMSAAVSTVCIPLEFYFYASDMSGMQMEWIITAFWHSLSFALLGAVCIIWAPVQLRQGYHSLEETREAVAESGIELQERSI